MRFNGSAFLMKYKDMQQDLDVPRPGPRPDAKTGRSMRSRPTSRALSWRLLARPTAGLTIHGNLGYLDAKYKDFFGDIYSTGTPVDATFLKIRRAPKWTWDVGRDLRDASRPAASSG